MAVVSQTPATPAGQASNTRAPTRPGVFGVMQCRTARHVNAAIPNTHMAAYSAICHHIEAAAPTGSWACSNSIGTHPQQQHTPSSWHLRWHGCSSHARLARIDCNSTAVQFPLLRNAWRRVQGTKVTISMWHFSANDPMQEKRQRVCRAC
jgi:hypothetical protein